MSRPKKKAAKKTVKKATKKKTIPKKKPVQKKRAKSKRTEGVEKDQCYACGVILTKSNTEWHHFPIPARCGGEDTVPLCIGCHDMVDRIPLGDWPVDWAFNAIRDMDRDGKLFLMKALSKLWH